MTNLATPNKDDYPGAAKKHLADARALIAAGRFDGAGYLIGYVIECSLRTVVMVGEIAQRASLSPSRIALELRPGSATLKRLAGVASREAREKSKGHDLDVLARAMSGYEGVVNTANARYTPAIDKAKPPWGGAWTESLRYRAELQLDPEDAKTWLAEADRVYKATVGAMIRDGLIT